MTRTSSDRNASPLDEAALERLALRYVGRYATTRAKLTAYLHRKVMEHGSSGDMRRPIESIITRFAGLGYVDDRLFGEARAASLQRRGYGGRRIDAALRQAGIEEEDRHQICNQADENAWESALAFARRRRIGPFATDVQDQDARRKAFAAMLRAGHDMDMARRIVQAEPGNVPVTL